ncbi:glycosyltransferase [uncultured Alistipes sp.]|jgi:hypothetical protein|uniref:glycosyltransferase n=1 Tax=uncultured Alistipes sp. TaxID=538949 RepID=UPI0025CE80EF|nr:glycosyltransferase [uncultured Alistipes sp.]
MKKILVILGWQPFPFTYGGNQAFYNGIEALRGSYDIYITYPTDKAGMESKGLSELRRTWPDVKIMPYQKQDVYKNRLLIARKVFDKLCRRFFKNNTYYRKERELVMSREYREPGFYDYIAGLVDMHGIDIAQIEFIPALDLVYALPDHVKKVFVHHELRYVRNELLLKRWGDDNSAYYKAQVKALTDLEIAQLNRYDLIVTLSGVDKEKLVKMGVAKPIFPSFAMVKPYDTQVGVSRFDKVLTFVGPEDHIPNKDGLEWFLTECWPKLLERDGAWRLHVIGKWVSPPCADCQGVTFLGFVNDLRQALEGTVMIVPIRIGSGIRMKILEAANIGVPFVSTTIGAEGLPFEDGVDCFIADEPGEFVEKILRLDDISLQDTFVKHANTVVRKYYSLERLRESRLEAYEMLYK